MVTSYWRDRLFSLYGPEIPDRSKHLNKGEVRSPYLGQIEGPESRPGR